MKRYILGASPTKQTALMRPFDENGVTCGEWKESNAAVVYAVADVQQLARECFPYVVPHFIDCGIYAPATTIGCTCGGEALRAKLREIIGEETL